MKRINVTVGLFLLFCGVSCNQSFDSRLKTEMISLGYEKANDYDSLPQNELNYFIENILTDTLFARNDSAKIKELREKTKRINEKIQQIFDEIINNPDKISEAEALKYEDKINSLNDQKINLEKSIEQKYADLEVEIEADLDNLKNLLNEKFVK